MNKGSKVKINVAKPVSLNEIKNFLIKTYPKYKCEIFIKKEVESLQLRVSRYYDIIIKLRENQIVVNRRIRWYLWPILIILDDIGLFARKNTYKNVRLISDEINIEFGLKEVG